MEKVILTSQNRKTSPEEIKKLYEEGQELNNNGACFHSWLNRLLDLPPVTPKKPFDETQSKEMTITQRDSENAKRRVEEWKGRMDDRYDIFPILVFKRGPPGSWSKCHITCQDYRMFSVFSPTLR